MEFSSYVMFLFILYTSAAFMPSFSSSVKHRCHDDERSALLQFKASFLSTNSCFAYSDHYSKVESWKLFDREGSGDCQDNTYLTSNLPYACPHMENLVPTGFSSLRVIDLSHNHFSGKVPLKLLQIPNAMKDRNTSHLTYMQDFMNPYSFYESSYLGYYDYSMTLYNKGLEINYTKIPGIFVGVDFSNNKFQGEVPDIIGNLKGLQLLNLSGNSLIGVIPSSLADLKALECLDLSENQLSGQIPMQLTELTWLSSFDVSFNNLSGPVPQGNQFCNFESKSYEGNPGLWSTLGRSNVEILNPCLVLYLHHLQKKHPETQNSK